MKNRDQSFTLVLEPQAAPIETPRRRRKQQRVALTLLLLVALLAAANWLVPGVPGNQGSAASLAVAAPPAREEFVYFPAQYLNQATEPTEHLQAF